MLTGMDWFIANLSNPVGNSIWGQGNTLIFGSHSAPANSFAAANYNSAGVSANATISNWLIAPEREFNNGDVISFWTRSATSPPTSTQNADRLQVRLSTTSGIPNVGASHTSVGDFDRLLLDINPNYGVGSSYPNTWTNYTLIIADLPGPTLGRFAFRYFVENGGPIGDRSNYIGIDTLDYIAIPEPASLILLATPLLLIRRHRRR